MPFKFFLAALLTSVASAAFAQPYNDTPLPTSKQTSLSVGSYAALRAFPISQYRPPPMVCTLGYTTTGDGGQGCYSWFAGDTTSPNGVNIVSTTTGVVGNWYLATLSNISIKQAGAVCDGTTQDGAALTALQTAGGGVIPPNVVCNTNLNPTTMTGPFRGPGTWIDAAAHKRAPNFVQYTSKPSYTGPDNSPVSYFNGDFSKMPFAGEVWVSGTTTLGQPATGFNFVENVGGLNNSLFNIDAGWNQDLNDNNGRTTVVWDRTHLYNTGQGGIMGHSVSCFVSGTKAGSTNFLANPACADYSAESYAGADGVYLNPWEGNCDDQGHDAACSGYVMNEVRGNITGAKGARFEGFLMQSTGAYPVDSMFAGVGPSMIGLDLSGMSQPLFGLQAAFKGAGGSGYVVGNTLPVAGGTGSPTVIYVDSVDGGGAITTSHVLHGGIYSVSPGNGTLALLGGSGSGATEIVAYTTSTTGAVAAYPLGCQYLGATNTGTPGKNSAAVQLGQLWSICAVSQGISIGTTTNTWSGGGTNSIMLGQVVEVAAGRPGLGRSHSTHGRSRAGATPRRGS